MNISPPNYRACYGPGVISTTIVIITPFIIAVVMLKDTLPFSAVFPAPLVEIRNLNNDNRSIVVSVSSPYNVDVKRYHMVYKFMGEYMTAETLVIKNETRFQYTLAKVGSYPLNFSLILN